MFALTAEIGEQRLLDDDSVYETLGVVINQNYVWKIIFSNIIESEVRR